MKYRLKINELADGTFRYFPQYKRLFRWKYFKNNIENTIVGFIEEKDALNFIEVNKIVNTKYINF